jgi:hypothetical protein
MNSLEKCVHYFISRVQRSDEIKKGWGLSGTRGYERIGCYECNGYNKDCRSYTPQIKIDYRKYKK